MTIAPSTRPYLWPLFLAAATIAGTLATACMMPFVALATVAAATTGRAQAMIAVLGAWAINQLIGFGLLGFPLERGAIGWGLALGGAALAVTIAARAVLGGRPGLGRVAGAFAGGFALFEALLFGWALLAGGTDTFTPAIVARLFVNEAAWGALMLGAHLLLAHRATARVARAA